MGSDTPDTPRAGAIAWHIRLRHGDDAAWDGFAAWLATDPRHAEAYDEIEQADDAIEELLPDLVLGDATHGADRPAAPPPSRWPRWGLAGGALAASVVGAAILVPQLMTQRYEVATGPGQHRTVLLDAGTRIVLNGSTRMIFDHKDPRVASLVAGEALFHVRHDDARPFTLAVGGNRIEDAGTVFDVVHDAGDVRVAVSEGRVIYNPGGDQVSLGAGQALVDPAAAGPVRLVAAPAGSVGAWQRGRLIYTGEPLSQVAADLGRVLGIRIAVAPAIADRPFSGAIVVDGAGADRIARLMTALNVTLETGSDGWTMRPAASDGR